MVLTHSRITLAALASTVLTTLLPLQGTALPTGAATPQNQTSSARMLAQSRSATLRSQTAWQPLNVSANSLRTRPITLWATYYHVYQAQNMPGGLPLLDPAGNRLKHALSQRDWCYGALQGTVLVLDNQGSPVTYNFAGRGANAQTDCSAYFSSLSSATLSKVNRVRFVAATAPYGYGTDGYNLIPYRTIAVDRGQIPIGSVIYIPEARGTVVTLPTGEQVVHDGYFYAADVGSALQGNHVDIFVGTSKRSPFSFIKSRSGGTFRAFLVQDAEIARTLQALHRR